jgi:hypothetical protein
MHGRGRYGGKLKSNKSMQVQQRTVLIWTIEFLQLLISSWCKYEYTSFTMAERKKHCRTYLTMDISKTRSSEEFAQTIFLRRGGRAAKYFTVSSCYT